MSKYEEVETMASNFHIKFRKNRGNLHFRPKGIFDGNSAWELINLIHDKYNGQGRVFIDTCGLGKISPFGCCIFKDHLYTDILPCRRLFFKGEKGFDIAPNGSRVLITPPRGNNPGHGMCRRQPCFDRVKKREKFVRKKA
jgi:hypothetical protein